MTSFSMFCNKLITYSLIVLIFALSSINSILAQGNLPPQVKLSPDLKRLTTGGVPVTGLYKTDVMKNIYINFYQPNYIALLENNYRKDTAIMASLTMDGVTYDSIGVSLKGNSSYTGLPDESSKYSFNIEMDEWRPDQNLKGYQTLNFHNGYNDPTFIREVFYVNEIQRYIPSQKACYIHLYINGIDWGLYPNVQQINKDFLEEWFFSNDGSNWRSENDTGSIYSALGYLGPNPNSYMTRYDLKSSDQPFPYVDLANAINVLNMPSSPEYASHVADSIDIDKTLWFLACENAFGDYDSYTNKGRKDYHIYYEPESHRLIPMQYDGNSTFGVGRQYWSPFYRDTNPNYPLLYRLLNVPEYRQRYTAHLREVVTTSFDSLYAYPIIDNYRSFIDSMVAADTKKLYSYQAFNDYIPLIKSFMKNRRGHILKNVELKTIPPVISNVKFATKGIDNAEPSKVDSVLITANVSCASGISAVRCYWSNVLTGKFEIILMHDDGIDGDALAGDSIFSCFIPCQLPSTWVRYYIEAKANNVYFTTAYSPVGAEHDVYVYFVNHEDAPDKPVMINEFVADNTTGVTDSAGAHEDWIELYNVTDTIVDLSGYFLSDDSLNLRKFKIAPGTTIDSHGYRTFWADDDTEQGSDHCNFKLFKGGEMIYFSNDKGQVVDKIIFGAQSSNISSARIPDGTGAFVPSTPTYGCNNSGLLPALNIQEPDTLKTCLGSIDLHCHPGTSYSYTWYRNGVLLPFQQSAVLNVTTSGIYSAQIVTPCGVVTSKNVYATVAGINPNITSAGTSFCEDTSMQLVAMYNSTWKYKWQINGVNLANSNTSVYNAKNTGNYRVIITASAFGCTVTSNSIGLTKLSVPASVITAYGPTVFCPGQNVKLKSNTGNFLTYQWKKDGVNILNAITPTYYASTTGSYRILITKGTCSKLSNEINVSVICRDNGDESNSVSDAIKVYPNPTHGIFELIMPLDINATRHRLEIYDNHGVLVKEIDFQSERIIIDLKGFAQGIYFCRIFSDGKLTGTSKLMID